MSYFVEPSLHVARGSDTRTDQERAADEFYANEYVILATIADAALAEYTIEHVHDEGCNGTLEHGEEILCGFPGDTGHIYCVD